MAIRATAVSNAQCSQNWENRARALRKMTIHQRVSGISPGGWLGMLPFLLWHLETSCLARRLPRIADRINRGTHSPPASRIRAGVAGAVASNGSWHFVMNAALAVPSRHHMASHSSSGMSCSSGARTVGLSFFPRLRPAPDPSKGLVLQIAQFHRPREPLCPFAERLRTTDYGPLFRNHVMPPEATYCICPSQQPSLTSLTMTPSIKQARLPIRAHARSFLFY